MKKKKSGFVVSGLDVGSNEQVNYVTPWKIKEKSKKNLTWHLGLTEYPKTKY